MELIHKKCVPCEGGVDALSTEKAKQLMLKISKEWRLNDKSIERTLQYINFKQTMDVVNKIAEIAESEGHHPDLHISYSELKISISTHAIDGLSENDFVLAAKLDQIV